RDHRGNGPRLRGTRVSRRRTRTRSGPVRSHTSRRPGGSRALGGARLTLVGGLDAEFVEALAGEIRDRRPASKDEVERIKLRLARAHRLGGLPSDGAILQRMALADREGMKDLLRVKPARTASGVAVVTVMTAPHGCPHGVCTYCPGGPRVEMGIQTTHEDVLVRVHRGHTDAQSREAMHLAKDAGLKVGVHMMPGLPGSDPDRDMESFRVLFEDPAYRPDFLKIYPTLVLPGTALHGLWKSGRYTPLGTEEAVELIARVKAIVPRWCRIQRVQREIGAPDIEDGPKRGDLRVLAKERLRSRGLDCHCVRRGRPRVLSFSQLPTGAAVHGADALIKRLP